MTSDPLELTFSKIPDPYLGEGVGLSIRVDPLGGLNSILRLYRSQGNDSVPFGKAVLYPIRAGVTVSLIRRNEPMIRMWGPSWQEITGGGLDDVRQPGCNDWVVTVDDEEVLRVPFIEGLPPRPPTPAVPLKVRARKGIRFWADRTRRYTADLVLARLGYTRTGECECEEDY